jgi:hypothetical protein
VQLGPQADRTQPIGQPKEALTRRFRTIPAAEDYAVVVTTDDEYPFTIQDVSQCPYPYTSVVAAFSREEATAVVAPLTIALEARIDP